ncbi:MAG: zinc ribbon domain-containing protein [Bacteroides cellulosilyticus]
MEAGVWKLKHWGHEKRYKMEEHICQSCGMTMAAMQHFGTNKDHSLNKDYCSYCYQNGEFTEESYCLQLPETCESGSRLYSVQFAGKNRVDHSGKSCKYLSFSFSSDF